MNKIDTEAGDRKMIQFLPGGLLELKYVNKKRSRNRESEMQRESMHSDSMSTVSTGYCKGSSGV